MQAFLELSGIDGYIVTIALSRGFIMASRDTASFQAAGVGIINSW
jgi:hypothetical protein